MGTVAWVAFFYFFQSPMFLLISPLGQPMIKFFEVEGLNYKNDYRLLRLNDRRAVRYCGGDSAGVTFEIFYERHVS